VRNLALDVEKRLRRHEDSDMNDEDEEMENGS